jgi:5-methylcytosine-specific restriction endonuclease McrA
MDVKTCSLRVGCGQELPIDQFSKDSRAKDGFKNICKPCAKEKHDIWKLQNPEYYRKYDSKRYSRDRDLILLRHKKFLDKNPDYHHNWYISNKKEHNRRSAQWAKDNPQKVLANVLKRKALKLEQMGFCPDNFWGLLIKAFGAKCMNPLCSKEITKINCLILDHIKPLSSGGMHDMNNFQILCRSCNCQKAIKYIDYRSNLVWS